MFTARNFYIGIVVFLFSSVLYISSLLLTVTSISMLPYSENAQLVDSLIKNYQPNDLCKRAARITAKARYTQKSSKTLNLHSFLIYKTFQLRGTRHCANAIVGAYNSTFEEYENFSKICKNKKLEDNIHRYQEFVSCLAGHQ